jgi:hypothetical protein
MSEAASLAVPTSGFGITLLLLALIGGPRTFAHFQFAIMIAPGNVRPCHGQSHVPRFGMLLPDRTRMVCIRRKIVYLERGNGR